MQWREMGHKDKVKDDGPPKDAYIANALFKRLSQCPFKCTVIPEGALVMAGMSLLWHDIKLYPSFQRDDEGMWPFALNLLLLIVFALTRVNVTGKWSLFDFVDPPRNAALRVVDRVIGEQEPDLLKVHLDQFLLSVVPADPFAYISQPHPSGGSNMLMFQKRKKPIWVKATGRKYMAAEVATSQVAGSIVEVQVEGTYSAPLTSVDVMPSATSGPSPSERKSQASYAAAVSSLIPPPVFTVDVVVTTSPASTPLPSSVIPTSLFDSHVSVFSTSEKEMHTAFAAHKATSVGGTAMSGVGGFSSGIVNDGARLGDDLYLPTISWDPNVQDKRYQSKWKIAESSRLIFPPAVHHWVERAYPPAESTYVEGLNNENLMTAMMVDSLSQPWRLAEIRRRWMHDNNELHQARAVIQELKDEKYRLESQLQAAGLKESRFVSEKNKAKDDLKRVTAHLAEDRILWALDIEEKDRVLAHA
ncbi:hypothetical protein Hanom_Chr11g01006181 [Helianthus anomalus]